MYLLPCRWHDGLGGQVNLSTPLAGLGGLAKTKVPTYLPTYMHHHT